MSRTLIKGGQIQLTDFIKALASADWTSDSLTVSAAAILNKIQSEIAGVTGAMQFRGAWSTAATDASSTSGIKKGYVYVYDGTGTAPTGVTLENGDTLIAKQDAASVTNDAHWVVVNVNITGAVTTANLVSSLSSNTAGEGSVTITAPSTGTNAGKLVITGAFPTVSGGSAESGKYVSAISINSSTGVISVTKANLPSMPDYRNYFVYGETPSGTIDGGNDTFYTTKKVLDANHVAVYVNGVRQSVGTGGDITISMSGGFAQIKFNTGAYIPCGADTLTCDYITYEPITQS